MNYNASLDDIIKQNKSKIGLKSRNRNWKNKTKNGEQNQNAKPAVAARLNIRKKQNPPVFKAKLKKRKMIGIPDARIKINQNKKKLRRMSVENMKSPLLKDARMKIDARLKIDARRQKKKPPPPRSNLISRSAAVTSLAPNGIIHRRINPNLSRDNGIRVEYEDDDMMSLENEPMSRADWTEKYTIRRTISNATERKRFPPTLMGYRDLDAEPEETLYERDTLPFNELTRTITNIKVSPSLRKNYSSRLSSPVRQRSSPVRQRSSPVRQRSSPIRQRSSPIRHRSPVRQRSSPMRQSSNDDMRDAPSKSSFLSRESKYSRESNFLSRDSNFSLRDSNYSSRESNYSSRDTSYASREPSYYRIMISNLHENVTSEDIKELFEDIGDLVYTKMTRSGTAEVAYKYEKDAMDAVEIYHNRQLDGLPMKCTLISNSSESSGLKKRHPRLPPVSTKSSIEPDTSLIKKALFN